MIVALLILILIALLFPGFLRSLAVGVLGLGIVLVLVMGAGPPKVDHTTVSDPAHTIASDSVQTVATSQPSRAELRARRATCERETNSLYDRGQCYERVMEGSREPYVMSMEEMLAYDRRSQELFKEVSEPARFDPGYASALRTSRVPSPPLDRSEDRLQERVWMCLRPM
jgi:hypothetical protein